MRTKFSAQGYLDFSSSSSTKLVREYRAKYALISEVLDSNVAVLENAHRDLSALSSSSRGRRSAYTSEQLLRTLVVMFVEGDSYRDVVVRVANSEFLQYFVRLGHRPMMDFTFLCRAFGNLSEDTWLSMNRILGAHACSEGKISSEKLRMDTTAYESNIHFPTDSSLLWDSFRTLARLLKPEMRTLGMTHRFHLKKVKKVAHYISRHASHRSAREKRRVKTRYGMLLAHVRRIAEIAREAERHLRLGDWVAQRIADELARYVPLVDRVVDQAQRRVFEGETVPSDEKIYSLFEAHTELLIRGKAGKPIEFGHKVIIAETAETFILHYDAYVKQRADKDLLDETLAVHRTLFSQGPDVLAADKGFYESMQKLTDLEKKIPVVSIAKKGRRTAQETEREHSEAFRDGQRFRAGSEGTISVLKRAFKLNRCLFKGFKNYAASVGCAVFCHNLVLLARL